jgi:hypothetical protein
VPGGFGKLGASLSTRRNGNILALMEAGVVSQRGESHGTGGSDKPQTPGVLPDYCGTLQHVVSRHHIPDGGVSEMGARVSHQTHLQDSLLDVPRGASKTHSQGGPVGLALEHTGVASKPASDGSPLVIPFTVHVPSRANQENTAEAKATGEMGCYQNGWKAPSEGLRNLLPSLHGPSGSSDHNSTAVRGDTERPDSSGRSQIAEPIGLQLDLDVSSSPAVRSAEASAANEGQVCGS